MTDFVRKKQIFVTFGKRLGEAQMSANTVFEAYFSQNLMHTYSDASLFYCLL